MEKRKDIFVAFDCDKMKHPNTGLYSFCHQLALALNQEALNRGAAFMVGLPSRISGIFEDKIPEHSYRLTDKIKFHCPSKINIWHAPFQLGKYFPKDKKTVLTIHDLNFLYEKDGKRRESGLRKLQKNINRSDYLVAISEFTKKDILKYLDIQGKPLDVIYNGCSVYTGEIRTPAKKPVRPFLFNLGTVLPKKNMHVLPYLLAGNDYELYIAGNRSPYENEIMAVAVEMCVADRVHILGPVKEEEKHWYLKHCEAFVFPSIAEGFGLPVIEAMYYGKPVFLSRHTCLPEIGQDKAYYFNYEFDPELMRKEFQEGMEHFSSSGDPSALKQHALSFSWENAAKAYWDIYERLF